MPIWIILDLSTGAVWSHAYADEAQAKRALTAQLLVRGTKRENYLILQLTLQPKGVP